MINNLSQNAIIDNATPISRNLLGLLGGPAKGFSSPRNSLLDFQNLVKLRLGSRSGDRNTIAGFAPPPADPLPFMAGAFLGKLKKVAPGTSPVALDSLSRKIVEPGHQPIGRVELASLKEITSIFKGFATKVGRPIAFKVSSKTLGPISVQIDPTKNRLNVTLTAEMPQAKNRQNVKETVLAELSAIFGSAPVVTFDQTAAGVVPPATRKAQPVPISQPDALEIIGTFMDLGDAGLLSADGLQIHLDLDVEGVGNVAVDLASEANKTFAQLRTNSTKTLSALKGMFLKSDVLDRLEVRESGHGVKISKANTLNAHPAPKAQVIANPNVGEEVTAPVSTKVGFEVIGNAIDAVLQPSKTAGAANKEIVHLQFESLGDVQVEIEPHQGKADLKVQVESPLAREVFEDRLRVWQSKISDVKISVRNKVGSLSRQTETNVAAVIGAKDDLTTPKVLQTIDKILNAATVGRSEDLDSRVRFTLPAKSMGEVTFDLQSTKKLPRVQLTVSSDRARQLLAARLGQKLENVEIRVDHHAINKEIGLQEKSKMTEVKGLEGQFKLHTKLSPSQAIQTIQEVLSSVSQPAVEGGQSKIKLQLTVDNFGPLTVEITKDVDGAHLQLRTDSIQARDWLNQHLSRAGFKVEDIQPLDQKKDPVLRVAALKPEDGISLGDKTEDFGQRTVAGPASRSLPGLLEVLFGRAKARTKLSTKRDAISTKESQQPSLSRKTGGRRKAVANPVSKLDELPEDESEVIQFTEDFKGMQLSDRKTEGTGASIEQVAEVDFIPGFDTQSRQPQPVLTLGNVQFNLAGNKMVGTSKVESSAMPEMIQRILEFTNLQQNSFGQKLTVQLDVERIGRLLVDAVRHKDKINLHVNVESTEVRRLLETQLRPLVDQMLKEGIELGKLEVSVREQNSQSGAEGQASDHDRSFAEEQNNKDVRDSFYPTETGSAQVRQRDFGYNSIEVLA